MMRHIVIVLSVVVAIAALSVSHVCGQQPQSMERTSANRVAATTENTTHFAAVDVFVDSGNAPLAAYQFELNAIDGEFKIVGVEGGEAAAFAEPPYYDPAALMQDRIIIAAFNTGSDLPSGKTRVARIHIEYAGNRMPSIGVELSVSAGRGGSEINATAEVAPASQG